MQAAPQRLNAAGSSKAAKPLSPTTTSLRLAVRAETGLTASAEVSYNKLLAKLASDHRKPDCLFVITPHMGPAFAKALPVGKFHDIGPEIAARMKALGIHTGLDLRAQSRAFLAGHFGKAGDYLHGVARGVDERPVQADRARKSVGAETTFERDLLAWDEVAPALHPVFAKVWAASAGGGHRGRTVTVKVKHADFGQVTRSRSCAEPVATQAELERVSLDLLRPLFPPRLGVRLLGQAAGHGGDQGGAVHAGQLQVADAGVQLSAQALLLSFGHRACCPRSGSTGAGAVWLPSCA